jgi:hypothetical protein
MWKETAAFFVSEDQELKKNGASRCVAVMKARAGRLNARI